MTDRWSRYFSILRVVCLIGIVLMQFCLTPARAQLSCTGESGLFDWDDASSTWAAGSLSNSYTADGEPVSVTFSGDTGFFLNILGAQTPFRTNALTGGLTPVEQGLLFVYNYPNTNLSVDVTITAGQPGRGVEQLQFTIFDLDTNGPTAPFAFQDEIAVTASLDGAPVTDFTFTTMASHTTSGNVITGINASGNTQGLANATIQFNSPVDTVVFNYRPGPNSQADPAQQGMSLHDISFCKRQDFSDAPATYGTPAHTVVDGIYLGGGEPDAEAASNPATNADGDDTTGADDEEAVSLPSLEQGKAANILVAATGSGGFLQGWIDWNGDGDFNDTVDGQSEQIAVDRTLASTTGVISIPVQVPSTATLSQTYARFRWSSTSGLDATSAALDGEVEDYTLTIAGAGDTISGSVFEDNGLGGGTAHDGVQNGTETDLGGLNVLLTNAGSGAVLSTGITSGDGSFQVSLPPAAVGQSVVLTVSVAGDYQAISESPGALPSLSNPSDTDGSLTFVPAANTSYANVDFGQIQIPELSHDRILSTDPGGLALATHTYTATTSGSVTFSLSNLDANPASAFSTELFLDANCSADIDGAEGPVTGASAVVAGQTVCLVVRHVLSVGAPSSAILTYDVEADTLFSGTAVTSQSINTDMVRVGDDGAIELIKQVCNTTVSSCNVTDGSGFGISNSGAPGDIIQYRILFRSSSPDGVENIAVFDATPDFSFLKAASATVIRAPAGMSCSVVTPAGGGSEGYEGDLEWQCNSGNMVPGDEGVVAFQVEIAN